MYGEGISRTGDLLDMGVDADIIEKSGSWYSYQGERMGQGRERVKQFFLDNPEIYNSLFERVRGAIGLVETEKDAAPAQDEPEST